MLTVCAVNFSGDWLDASFRQRWQAHLRQLRLRCQTIAPEVSFVVLRVPPQDSFD